MVSFSVPGSPLIIVILALIFVYPGSDIFTPELITPDGRLYCVFQANKVDRKYEFPEQTGFPFYYETLPFRSSL